MTNQSSVNPIRHSSFLRASVVQALSYPGLEEAKDEDDTDRRGAGVLGGPKRCASGSATWGTAGLCDHGLSGGDYDVDPSKAAPEGSPHGLCARLRPARK